MPYTRPTLSEQRQLARADFQLHLAEADALLRQSNVRVLADVQAGLIHGLLDYLAWIVEQILPDTAQGVYLLRWASIFFIERKAAAKASGAAVFTGIDGSVIDAGTPLQAADGTAFITSEAGAIAGGSAEITIEAALEGAAGNLDAGVKLQLSEAVAGVDAEAEVAAGGTVGGADEEPLIELRERFLARLREPPQGGAAHDYVAWAREVAGVTRAWVYKGEMGAGTVTVRFMMDDVRAAQNGIPQGDGAPDYSGDLALVFDHIEEARPVPADLYVAAPVAVPLNITIGDLNPDTPAVRAAIEAEVKDLLRRDAVPGGTIYLSRLIEAISVAAGESSHTLTAPAANVAHGTGEIAVPGAFTYV